MDFNFPRKGLDRVGGQDSARGDESLVTGGRNERMRREEGSFLLAVGFLGGRGIHKHALVLVEEQMAQFVEQTEPEYVSPSVPNAQLDNGFSADPLSCALRTCPRQVPDKDQGDTAAREERRHARTKNRGRLSRETSKLGQGFQENISAERCDLHPFGIALTSHEPCPECFPGRRDLGRSTPCGLELALLNVIEGTHTEEAKQLDGAVEPILDIRHPAVCGHLAIWKLFRQRDFPLLEPLAIVQSREILAVVGLKPRPDVRRNPEHALELERRLRGDFLYSLDDLVDCLDRPAGTPGEFCLLQAKRVEGFRQQFPRGNGEIGPTSRLNCHSAY